MWKFDDAKTPTDTDRRRLARLMYIAFCDLRRLAREGRSEQAKDLAEAFHNIPLLMYHEDFSFKAFHYFLQSYQEKYSENANSNYLLEWEKVVATIQ